jgi:hypothetical protein
MAGHSRPKDGVLSHAYVPAISLRKATLCQIYRDRRDKFAAGPAEGRTRLPGDDGT